MNREVADSIRVPPWDATAEQAVLGGIMLSQDGFDRVADMLIEQDFYRRDHQLIYRAIREMAKRGKPYDAVTLGAWLDSMGLQSQVGMNYLVELATTVPSAARIRAYADIVAEASMRRQLIDAGTRIANSGWVQDGRPAIELIGEAHTAIGSLTESQPTEVVPMSVPMGKAFSELSDFHDRGGGIDGLATGFTDYDEILNGLLPGMHILAGRPKMGKSTLAQNIAEYVSLQSRKAVLIVTFEMTPEQFAKRMISSVADVDASRVRTGRLDQMDWTAVSQAQRDLRNAPLYIAQPHRSTPEAVCALVRKQHAETPLACVVLDYLQLMEFDSRSNDNTATSVARGTRMLVKLGQQLRIPVIVVSQLNRKVDERPNKRPMPSDLRDSGAIEQDAESVTFVYRDEVYHTDSRFKGTMEVNVALNRNGPPGDCRLLYRGDRYRCENLPFAWEPAPRIVPTDEQGNATKSSFRKTKVAGSKVRRERDE